MSKIVLDTELQGHSGMEVCPGSCGKNSGSGPRYRQEVWGESRRQEHPGGKTEWF